MYEMYPDWIERQDAQRAEQTGEVKPRRRARKEHSIIPPAVARVVRAEVAK